MTKELTLSRIVGKSVDIYRAAFGGNGRKSIGGHNHEYVDKMGANPFANRNDCFANLFALGFLEYGELSGAIIGPQSASATRALSHTTAFESRFAQIIDGILARINRVVRQELTESDLSIIVDDDLFDQTKKIGTGDDPFGLFRWPVGFFLNRAVIGQTPRSEERALYETVFSVIDRAMEIRADRIVLVPRQTLLCSPWTVVHEVIHDVMDVNARKEPKEFTRLVVKLFELLKSGEQFACGPYGKIKNGKHGFGHLFWSVTKISYWCIGEDDARRKEEAVKEFAAKLFSGQLIDRSSENEDSVIDRFTYYYLQTNMPQDIRDMFFGLGLRWPPAIKLPTDKR
jgi:hypothetical protein